MERARVGEIASLPMRFAAVATDLRSGEPVILDRGDLGRAVKASSSAPGLLDMSRQTLKALIEAGARAALEALPEMRRAHALTRIYLAALGGGTVSVT